jgi:hypothetical protein
MLWYPSEHETTKLTFASSIHNYNNLLTVHPNIGFIEKYLRHLNLKRVDTERAITWLELYIHYRTLGFPKPLKDHPNKARSGIPIDQQFQQFKLLVRKVVERACLPDDESDLFKPSKVMWPNLNGVGLEGKHPAVCFNIALEPQVKDHLAKKLLLVGAFHKSADVEAFIKGEKAFKPRPYTLRGKQIWDAKIPTAIVHEGTTHMEPAPGASPTKVEMHLARCPKCQQQNPTDRLRFSKQDLDTKITCRACTKPSPARSWKCSCEVIWHTCTTHVPRPLQVKHKAVIPKVSASRSGYSASSHLKVLDDELHRESKHAKRQDVLGDEDIIILESVHSVGTIRESMLPVSLRDKFPGVCTLPAA